ncbi:MAG: hypothetical protein ACYDHA_02935 [Bellilinea sp.]
MGNAIRRLQQRKKALNTVSDLMSHPDNVVVIHYSCESFYDRPDGSSPRITSIAVRNLATGQTTSFSIHQVAEREKVSHDEIEQNYDHLEKLMLGEFYEYVHIHSTHKWLHWNMRDINYGFAAIGHRYKVLSGQPVEIHESNIVDLARIIKAIYGGEYVEHPRLAKLVEKNNITDLDFLAGANEAAAFENKEYVKLHQSTLRKVDVLANIIERVDTGTLKTNSTWKDLYGNYPKAVGELLKEHWLASIITFLSAVAGIIMLFVIK